MEHKPLINLKKAIARFTGQVLLRRYSFQA
jgi:hypothetical protein